MADVMVLLSETFLFVGKNTRITNICSLLKVLTITCCGAVVSNKLLITVHIQVFWSISELCFKSDDVDILI